MRYCQVNIVFPQKLFALPCATTTSIIKGPTPFCFFTQASILIGELFSVFHKANTNNIVTIFTNFSLRITLSNCNIFSTHCPGGGEGLSRELQRRGGVGGQDRQHQ